MSKAHDCLHEREFGELNSNVKYIKTNLDKYASGTNERLEHIEKEVMLNSDDRKFRSKRAAFFQFAAGSGWATAIFSIIITAFKGF